MSIVRLVPLLVLSAALASPLAASAQTTASPAPAASSAPMGGAHHHRHHRPSLMRQLQSLNLTDAQKQQIAAFRSQQQQSNANADPATKRANAMKMRQQIMSVLTPDQKTQLQSQMQHHGRTMGNGASPVPDPSASPSTR